MQRPGAAMVGELLGKVAMRRLGLGGDHHARCVAVQPVHDAGALDPTDTHQALPAMKQQRIDQRAIGRTGGRVHHHAHRLVDHDQLVVLIEDVERDILRQRLGIFGRWGKKGDCLARR
ncbi:hypothetical protein D9M68_833220 [compost metagenome]